MRVAKLVVLLVTPAALAAQQSTSAGPAARAGAPRTPAEVIARYVVAMGGEAALRRIHTRHTVAEMYVGEQLGVTIETFVSGGKVLIRSTMKNVFTRESGFDGTIGWTVTEGARATLLPDSATTLLRASRDLQSALHVDTRSMTLGAIRQLEGKSVIALHVVPAVGEEVTEYFDLESGLLVAVGKRVPDDQGVGPVMVFEDFQPVDGVMIARRMTHKTAAGDALIVRVTHVDHAPMDSTRFIAPASVRELKAARAP